MTTAEAHVATTRAARYLDQLAKHFVHQPGGITAEPNPDGSLHVDFGGPTCRIQTTPNALTLYAEAATPNDLGQLQHRLTQRLEQLGHRDALTVHWTPDYTSAASPNPHEHRRH
jgi:uncharacterized protein